MAILLSIVWKSTVVLMSACVVGFALRRASAATRHLAWALALASLLALPALLAFLPAWPITFFATPLDSSVAEVSAYFEAASSTAGARNVWPRLAWAVWAAGAAVVLTRLLADLAAVRRMGRRASRMAGATFETATARLGVRRPVALLKSDRALMPMTWGLWRPVILLPEEAEQWADGLRHNVLMHEMAHLKRRDWLTRVMARVVCAVYWFHPLAWLAAAQMLKESERACDDLVLREGAAATEYAGQLLEVARSMRGAQWAWAAVAMARPSQLEGRLVAILESGRNRRAPTLRTAIVMSAAVALLVLPLAAMRPQGGIIRAGSSAAFRAGRQAESKRA